MTSSEVRFIQLYNDYQRRVTNYCGRRVAADKIDDAVADTFMTAWRRIEQIPEGDAALAWLYGVAYKVVGHHWRSSSRRIRLNEKLASLGMNPVSSPDEIVLLHEENRKALDAFKKLRPIDREILMLAGWEELPHRDIASVLGISADAVGQRLFKARKRLTQEYHRQERPAGVGPDRKGSR